MSRAALDVYLPTAHSGGSARVISASVSHHRPSADATRQGLAERAGSTGSATSRQRLVTELASAPTELDLVGAVIAASHQAADD